MAAQAESVTRAMVKDILAACAAAGQEVDRHLAAFMVKAVVLHSAQAIGGGQLTKDDVQRIVEECTAKLLDGGNPALHAVKMQIHFDTHYRTFAEVLRHSDGELEAQLLPEYQEIIAAKVETSQDMERLYRKIVSSCLLRSGLGEPTDIAVVRETTAALESVLPPEELGSFVALDAQEKLLQLQDLSDIVGGIRLHNMGSGKGGAGIENLPVILGEVGVGLAETIGIHYPRQAAAATEWCAAVTAGTVAEGSLPATLGHVAVARQLCFYLALVQAGLADSAQRLQDTVRAVRRTEDALKGIIKSKRSVATDKVYPLFIELGGLWRSMQVEGLLLDQLSALVAAVVEYGAVTDGFDGPREVVGAAAGAVNQRLSHAMKQAVGATTAIFQGRPFAEADPPAAVAQPPITAAEASPLQLLQADRTHGHDSLPLDVGGFCPVEVTRSGAIVPADRQIGLLRHEGRNYGFCSAANAAEFARDPRAVMAAVVARAREDACLIELLQLQAAFAPGEAGAVPGGPAAAVVKCDGGTQTEVHPTASNIVKDYEWNEWELRRKALKLANLRQKKTHSTQTQQSNYRRDNETQVYLPKTQSTMTKTDGATNTPKPQTYIRGLRGPRGRHATPVEVVDLTLDVRVGGLGLGSQQKKKPAKVSR